MFKHINGNAIKHIHPTKKETYLIIVSLRK